MAGGLVRRDRVLSLCNYLLLGETLVLFVRFNLMLNIRSLWVDS